MSATSLHEIDKLITELESSRDMPAEPGRVGSARDRSIFDLKPAALQSTKIHHREPDRIEKGFLMRKDGWIDGPCAASGARRHNGR